MIQNPKPPGDAAGFYDAFSADYDRFVDWPTRLALELPFLIRILKGTGARRVLDCACGTGMHAIALAQKGFSVFGADASAGMVAAARSNADAAGVTVPFEQAAFGKVTRAFGGSSFDALLCLGNSLPHVSDGEELTAALLDFAASLKPGGLLIIQNLNYDALMERRQKWMHPESSREGDHEWVFLRSHEFEPDGSLLFQIIRLHRQGLRKWEQAVNTARLLPLRQVYLVHALTDAGFSDILARGDLLQTAFDPVKSENLVVLAALPKG